VAQASQANGAFDAAKSKQMVLVLGTHSYGVFSRGKVAFFRKNS
jgi:hypothetical protein